MQTSARRRHPCPQVLKQFQYGSSTPTLTHLDIKSDNGQVVADGVDVVGRVLIDRDAGDGLGVVGVLSDELSVGESPHAHGAVAALRVGWGGVEWSGVEWVRVREGERG